MRTLRLVAVAAAGCAIAAAVALPATAGAGHPASATSIKLFPSKIHPAKNVRTGQILTDTGHHAKKNTPYTCLFIVTKGTKKGTTYGADLTSLKSVTSNGKGVVKCKQTFKPFKVTDTKGKARHCPLTKADAKAGFDCAIGLATSDNTSGSIKTFKAHASK
jgi:hypothetical protein